MTHDTTAQQPAAELLPTTKLGKGHRTLTYQGVIVDLIIKRPWWVATATNVPADIAEQINCRDGILPCILPALKTRIDALVENGTITPGILQPVTQPEPAVEKTPAGPAVESAVSHSIIAHIEPVEPGDDTDSGKPAEVPQRILNLRKARQQSQKTGEKTKKTPGKSVLNTKKPVAKKAAVKSTKKATSKSAKASAKKGGKKAQAV